MIKLGQSYKGCIAQSVEQSAFNQLVVGSNPTIPNKKFYNKFKN